MLFTNEFKEGIHVRSPEVVDRFESSEHAAIGYSLEMIFTNILENKL